MKSSNYTSVTDYQKRIGDALKALRINAGYKSSKSFAQAFNLPAVQYWRIENGRTNVTLKSIYRILQIHKVDPIQFLSRLDGLKTLAGTTFIESSLILTNVAVDDTFFQSILA